MPQTESLVAVQPEIEPNSDYSITMVGHSTFLVKMAGVNILTDPVSTSQLFPYAPFGYGKRISPAGLNLYETPVKVVVLSHSDPDHFEPRIIEAIAKTYKPDIAILPIGEYPPLPLAVAKYFISKGFNIPQVLIDKLKKLEEIKRKKVHMSPEDVLLLSKHFHQIVVMHHGTYFLCGHIDPNEPADLMRRLIEENHLEDKIAIPAPGESLPF